MAVANIVINDVSISPNPVNSGQQYKLAVGIIPETFEITTMDDFSLIDTDGYILICKEE